MESTKKTLKKADTLTVEDAVKQADGVNPTEGEPTIAIVAGSTGESEALEDEQDEELQTYQKKRKTPMFRLSSVNVDEDEQVLMEV